MRPFGNFKILIGSSFPPSYWDLHQVPACQVYCGFTKRKPSPGASALICAQVCKQLVGKSNWHCKILITQQSCLECISKWKLKRWLISNSAWLISHSSQCLRNVWNTSCLLFCCSKHWRNDLPVRHIGGKNFQALSFISLKQSGSWKRACGQQPDKTTKSKPGSYPTIISLYYHILFVAVRTHSVAKSIHMFCICMWVLMNIGGFCLKLTSFFFILYSVDGDFL